MTIGIPPNAVLKNPNKTTSQTLFAVSSEFQLAVNAKLTPSIVIPRNAKPMHKFRLCVIVKLSEKSCRATLAMIPAVIANMHPYTVSPGALAPLPAALNHNAAIPAPRG